MPEDGKFKLRLIYAKTGLLRFTSHRDLMRIFFRAFSRIGLPIRYSEGYSPHPRVTFCPPLKVGMEGLNEVMEIYLAESVDQGGIIASLNKSLPVGMTVKEAYLVPANSPSLGKLIQEAEYRAFLTDPPGVTVSGIEKFLDASEVKVEYKKEGKIKDINVRPGVVRLDYAALAGEESSLSMVLSIKENNRPSEVLSALAEVEHKDLIVSKWQRMGFSGPALKSKKDIA